MPVNHRSLEGFWRCCGDLVKCLWPSCCRLCNQRSIAESKQASACCHRHRVCVRVWMCVCVEPRPEQIHPYDDPPHTSCCLTGCLQSWAAGALWWPDVKQGCLCEADSWWDLSFSTGRSEVTVRHRTTLMMISRCVFICFSDILPTFVLQLLKCANLLLFWGFWTVCWTENTSWRRHFELWEVVTGTFYRPNK